jgi:nitrogen fixation NifU-like protein
MEYTDKVMDYFMNPRNVGVIENPDGYARVGSPACGDVMEIFLKIENDIIEDVKFRTFGCASAIATSSISTEMILGKHVDEAFKITNRAVADALGGLPSSKLHCSVLAEEAVRDAIEDYMYSVVMKKIKRS